MRIISITLLLFAGVVLSSCARPIPEGFACVTPIHGDQLKRAQFDMSGYQETPPGSGRYVPKGWVAVPEGQFKACYVPFQNHNSTSTVSPTTR
jgi:hypothetical protein